MQYCEQQKVNFIMQLWPTPFETLQRNVSEDAARKH